MATTTTTPLKYVPANVSFAKEEEKVLQFWNDIDAFKTSLKKSEGKKPYSFYDGPPFATGLPHYGHILAGTIKDTVTRYAHQTGHYVERRFGWDCHGLPIEFEIEKLHNIKTREEVLAMGIKQYNTLCRGIVMRYAEQWRTIVTRLGRWIDFDNDYKTMNFSFMESVWWVFKQLFDKGLVYRGFKVMPYSTACTTPLSNFEAGSNYKEVSDPAVVVTFPLVEDPTTSFLAWTTTPWTLPSNLALCVNPEFTYVKLQDVPTGKQYILAETRIVELYKKNKTDYKILDKYKGTDLVGKKYVPLFDFFQSTYGATAFRVIADGFVTANDGTGIVHCAPGFGEDDYRVCLASAVIVKGGDIPCPIDANGRFVDPVTTYLGTYVKEADNKICEDLKANGRLVSKGSIIHNYPFCWRSETPLLYRAVPSWFVRVEQIKPLLLKNNDQTYWVPDFVKSKRFHNWLEDARDWAISRSRYWGTPLPIWVSDDWEEIVAIGSVQELEELTGQKVTDLHRENIDHLTIPSKKGKGVLKRVEDVFDCWFESGSMPYAQKHYPFENKESFEQSFPADFIAEGLDQTRGWFYTLLVLSTALFDKPPFKNLIVNGLVLASDGKKMSKRLKNYPDPMDVVNECGADALRLYLINSPVVRAESLKFKKDGVNAVIRDVFLQWFNAYRFFVENAMRYQSEVGELFNSVQAAKFKSTNIMDQWVTSLSQSLIKFVREEMAAYRLYTVTPKLVGFIEQLTNWYVRMNRKRLKGDAGKEEWYASLATLFDVLYTVDRLMAPFTPFFTEFMYQNLRLFVPENEREQSVHFVMMPEFDASRVNPVVERAIARMQSVVVTGRTLRDKKNISLKNPVAEYIICHMDAEFVNDVSNLEHFVKLELNTKSLKFVTEVKEFMKLSVEADMKALGTRLRQKLKAVSQAVQKISHDDVVLLMKNGSVTLEGEELSLEKGDLKIVRTFIGNASKYEGLGTEDAALVILDHVITPDLKEEGQCRQVTSTVQQLRKKAKLIAADKVDVTFASNDAVFVALFNKYKSTLEKLLRGMNLACVAAPWSAPAEKQIENGSEDQNVDDMQFTVVLSKL